jgi:uncharacterized caspase-like protein
VGALTPAHAEKRVALVLGDGAHRRADKLADPVSAKRGMRDTLTKLCFDVTYGRQCHRLLRATRRVVPFHEFITCR